MPLSAKEATAKAAALRRKALQRSATRALSLGEAHSSGLARLLVAAKAKTKQMLPGHLIGGRDVERAGDEATERAQSAADAAGAQEGARWACCAPATQCLLLPGVSDIWPPTYRGHSRQLQAGT